jgi:hypothetical protein
MGENKQNAEKTHKGLSANLYQFQSQFQELLPDFYLQSGEVKKVGDVAVRGTASMDIYEGLYLGRERVDIKAIRTMKFDEQSKRVRNCLFTSNLSITNIIDSASCGRPKYGNKSGSVTVEDTLSLSTDSVNSMDPSRK